jgi:CheY-like chemotaxis protein
MARQTPSRRSVLYVEDDPNDVFFMQDAFQEVGISEPLQVVRDGQEAVDYLAGASPFEDREKFPLPCLVLLDLQMPKRDGLSVLDWIRSQPSLKGMVVIVLSSSAHPKDIDRAYELGANSFVVKPVSVLERIELTKRFKDWWLGFNQFASIYEGHPAWDAGV